MNPKKIIAIMYREDGTPRTSMTSKVLRTMMADDEVKDQWSKVDEAKKAGNNWLLIQLLNEIRATREYTYYLYGPETAEAWAKTCGLTRKKLRAYMMLFRACMKWRCPK